jgi:hypothetical protein
MKSYKESALGMKTHVKISPRWYRPLKVLQKVGQVSYKIQLPDKCKLHDTFHVSHLKKHTCPNALPNPILPLVTKDGKVKNAPLAILQRRIIPRSVGDYDVAIPQWLVHWDTMTAEEAT